jgi:hypothetical protein
MGAFLCRSSRLSTQFISAVLNEQLLKGRCRLNRVVNAGTKGGPNWAEAQLPTELHHYAECLTGRGLPKFACGNILVE